MSEGYNINQHRFESAHVRASCYEAIREIDRKLREGQFANSEEYQASLARIRDYGIMHGLTARIIRDVFRNAHADAVNTH